jgi:ankyrin repeat protein
MACKFSAGLLLKFLTYLFSRFLLAQLHLDSLRGKMSTREVRIALSELPTGPKAYKSAYEGALKRIEAQHPRQVEVAKQAISWITCAKRPLNQLELEHAIAVVIGQTRFYIENLCPAADLVSLCAGLVVIDEKCEVVRLVHLTTHHYFEQNLSRWYPEHQFYLASTCTAYLSFGEFSRGPCYSKAEFRHRELKYPLYRYASLYWGHHAQHASGISETVMEFLRRRNSVNASIQLIRFTEDEYGFLYEYLDDYDELDYDELDHDESDMCESEMADNVDDCIDDRKSNHLEGYVDDRPTSYEIYGTGLHLASHFDLHIYVDAILSRSNTKLDPIDRGSRTPLSWAAEQGSEAVVTLLIAQGANIESRSCTGRTPLSWAAQQGHEAVATLLLANGADINSRDVDGRSPLSMAVEEKHETLTKLLIAKGADVNSKCNQGYTPLIWAANRGYVGVATLLLDSGAELESRCGNGWTPLLTATAYCSTPAVEILLRMGAHVDSRGNDNKRALTLAAERNASAIVELLLVAGANIGVSPLLVASNGRFKSIIELLLDRGANLEGKDEHGRTPLSLAAGRGILERRQYDDKTDDNTRAVAARAERVAVVEYLLNHGADVESRDNHGRTPLSWAAEEGFVAVVQLLLDRGAVIGSKDERGWTPLSWALKTLNGVMAMQLINRGAVFELGEGDNLEQLLFAAMKGHKKSVKMLLRSGGKTSDTHRSALQHLIEGGVVDEVELLIDIGADIEFQDEQGRTPLSWASGEWDSASVKILLQRGANVESADKQGRTPLLWAARVNTVERVLYQMLQLPDPDAFGDDGRPPPVFRLGQRPDPRAVMTLLLDGGANIEARDEKLGETALSFSVWSGDKSAVELLLERGADLLGNRNQTPLPYPGGPAREVIFGMLAKAKWQRKSAEKMLGIWPPSD